MAAPNLKYMVAGQGWAVSRPQSMVLAPRTVVDTSQAQWSALAGMVPVDAIMLDQQTYDFATSSNGVIGLYLDVNRVRCGPGVQSTALDPPTGDYWNRPSHPEKPAYTTCQSLAGEKAGLKGARCARIASGD
jgi:hypothetical protein